MHRVNRLHTKEEGFGQRTSQFEIQLGAGRYSNLPGVGKGCSLLRTSHLYTIIKLEKKENQDDDSQFKPPFSRSIK